MSEETCFACDEDTGICPMYCECGKGPFCSDCWYEHWLICDIARGM